ncbi:MAG: DUF2971 domain-containing protein [Oscillospiraceae bacterium]|nr:DUF2971 domain-containing protein [Oscillospiraceae bacterium]
MDINNNGPTFLYHYTNVDSLALILKNKSIRLNSLDQMDDLQEQDCEDKQNFGKFVFVSSWTSDSKESIPMWRMYTPKQRGIRIKLPVNPFKKYTVTAEQISDCITCSREVTDKATAKSEIIIPVNQYFNNEFYVSNFGCDKQLFKVTYTQEKSLLRPHILETNNKDSFSVHLSKLGKYKNQYWEFQKEWRYILLIYPMSQIKLTNEALLDKYDEIKQFYHKTILGQASLPFNYYDLKIDEQIFNQMSITLAPDISESSKTIVDLLIKEYNPNCNIEESELDKLLR